MFLILLQYIRPVAAVEHFMEAHTAFLQKYFETGQFILSGRRKPKSGSLILCKASSRKEVEEIMKEDPLEKFQLALYEIIEFEPQTYATLCEK
ncbi:YciI family protein [Chitinophaga sp. sic0106]|uniref:YciI family protein n=1 Tax=Chitinophaga sp. sic0106 TaxID=2854785 RepID=UPI001C45DEDE|nr:YciI family protein [Chitinophaga sp. sic0106]MBV7528761.1 GTP cyclohydrolase [Chitinophaga sp. sic0106]